MNGEHCDACSQRPEFTCQVVPHSLGGSGAHRRPRASLPDTAHCTPRPSCFPMPWFIDPFHLAKLANDALPAARRRVTFDAHSRHGGKQDPEWVNRRRPLELANNCRIEHSRDDVQRSDELSDPLRSHRQRGTASPNRGMLTRSHRRQICRREF